MHYWTCITQYKLGALSRPSKNSQAKFKWMEADRHIFALTSVCGFQKASAVTLTCTNFKYSCTCLLFSPSCRNALAPQTGRDTGDRFMQQFCVCRVGISPAHLSARRKGCQAKEEHRYLLGAASGSNLFWTHINFGSLTSSSEKFLIFKALQIFTALGPLREKQTIFTFLLTLPFSGPQMDDKDHRGSFLRCFRREGRVDTKNAGG